MDSLVSVDWLAERLDDPGVIVLDAAVLDGGIAACAGALALVRAGYENVAVYDGSMSEWTSDPSRPLEV